MYSSSKPRLNNEGLYIVKDPFKLLVTGLFLVLIPIGIVAGLILAWLVGYNQLRTNTNLPERDQIILNAAVLATLGFFLGLLIEFALVFYYKANRNGVVIDFTAGTMAFPGGHVAANEVTDYFKLKFIFQVFTRYTIRTTEIRQINFEKVKNRSVDPKTKKVDVSYSYLLRFNGSFGAASISFDNQGKCEEITSAIRQINGMGSPIIRG